MKVTVLFVAFCLFYWTEAFPEPTEVFSRSEVLKTDKYRMLWNIVKENITVEIQVKTLGWCGFGISPNGGMSKSDVVIGWVKDGQTFFHDRFAEQEAIPPIDESQDWHLLQGLEKDGFTVLKFTRYLRSCDTKDRNIEFELVHVIFAFNEEDPESAATPKYHTTRGTKQLDIMEQPLEDSSLPDDVQVLYVGHTNLTIPPKDTFYLCESFRIDLPEKHHIVKFEMDVEPGNEDIMHHLTTFVCHGVDINRTVLTECGSRSMLSEMDLAVYDACNTYIFAWAVGGKPLVFDDHVGMPIGGPGSPTIFMFQTHYDNPQRAAGRMDASKMKIYITRQLRENDIGLLAIGNGGLPGLLVPPRQSRFKYYARCPHECTDLAFDNANTTTAHVYAVFHHSHLIGRGIRTRHYRGDKELDPILNEPGYDFNFQQTRRLSKEVEIRKGDEVAVECDYESTDRDVTTQAGTRTTDEMCITYLFVYPMINPICDTFTAPNTLTSIVGVTEVTGAIFEETVVAPESLANQTLKEVLASYDWENNPESVQLLQQVTENHEMSVLCHYDGRLIPFLGLRNMTMRPYTDPQEECTGKTPDGTEPPPSGIGAPLHAWGTPYWVLGLLVFTYKYFFAE